MSLQAYEFDYEEGDSQKKRQSQLIRLCTVRDKEVLPQLGLLLDIRLPALLLQLLFLQTRVFPQGYPDMLGGNLILWGELRQTPE